MTMDKIYWIVFAFLADSLIPLNGAFNARLGAAAASPIYASMISFAIGTLAIAVFALVTRQPISWVGVASAPWYAWLGGICGAISLTAVVLTYPRLGLGLGLGLLVAGQLIVSVLLEHFNILVAQPHPVSLLRIVGVALVLGGVILIRTF
jgi:bacterial/archaeal transporter family-2 protein